MALSDIHDLTRRILYGSGLGEKPAIRLAASNANEDVTGDPLVAFTLASGEGAKVKAGNQLAAYSPSDATKAFVVYVTSISTDTITGVNGGMEGAPKITGPDSGDLDDTVLEQNPLVTSHSIHDAIDTIVARHLWPDLYNIETKTVSSPDLVDGQEAVASDVMEVLSAWQRIGSTNYSVAFSRYPWDVDTSLASTGKMLSFDWIDGSTGYYTVKTKIAVADDDGDPELTRLIATGAAALSLSSALVETTLSSTKKDNIEAVGQRNQVGGLLWRDFLTLKQEYARELGDRNEHKIIIDRG